MFKFIVATVVLTASLATIVFLTTFAFRKMNQYFLKGKKMKLISSFMLLVMLSTLASCGFETVDTGNRGIKITFGEVKGEPLPEGLYFYNPFTSDIKEYPVRETTLEKGTEVFTKDTQKTTISYAVTYYPDPKKVGSIFKEIGERDALEGKIINPEILGIMKDMVGGVEAGDLVAKREQITKNTFTKLKDSLDHRGVVVTNLQFTNIDFDDEYEKAVEAKATAIQLALKAKNETVQIQEEAKQAVIKAEADARAMKIKSEALSQNKSLVNYEFVQKWDGALPMIMGGNGSILNIPSSMLERQQKE